MTLNSLIEYEKKYAKKLKLLEIDLEFYHSFVELLLDKDYAPNTIGSRIKCLKMFLNEAFKKKIPVCLDFKLSEFNPHCSLHPVSFSKSKFRFSSGSILSTTDFFRMNGAGSNLSAL